MIIKDGIENFAHDEVEIIANIARYHRGKAPKKNQGPYSLLPDKNTRKLVKKLSSMVRMADGLDREHISVVKDLECIYDSFSQVLYISLEVSIPDIGLEIWAAEKKKALFEKVFGVKVVFRVNKSINPQI
jgi:exopolyphosphatase/guanosine-5'-triphosphate,3'-diphosphate pyrophosphatase